MPPPSSLYCTQHQQQLTGSFVLADGMVTLITEKLGRQTLDDHGRFITRFPRSSPHCEPVFSSYNSTDQKAKLVIIQTSDPWDQSLKSGTHFQLETPPFCSHTANATQKCLTCFDPSPSTPPAPPKKRHCRSLSIPGDSSVTGGDTRQALLHRPVALRPHLNNNKLSKNRNSPTISTGSSRGGSTLSLPGLQSSFNFFPATSISSGGPCHSSGSNEYFFTPPESPVPRPASASSGYYDSSLSSLGAPWLEHSPLRCSGKYEAFKLRSLSLEDQISEHTSQCTSGSMPVMPGAIGSTPSSPRRQRIPRCRSQPCVLQDRKCGLKRRREEDRPALDFLKMKETAIEPVQRWYKGINIPLNFKSSRSLASEFASLNPIASSPLDSSIPSTITAHTGSATSSPTLELQEKNEDSNNENQDEFVDRGYSTTTETSDSVDANCSDTCSCHDNLDEQSEEEEEDHMFHIDVANDIDLDQIEKD
ncbi:protein FAM53A [Lingula anatina]|uniref:Protein FAM53A n=1 Tax=Lingula anatina TaxID=7574 RepID=A0A1S3HAA9_LINAN|nr:protein FAM53A [Lingula anatina]XP_013383025.1 protein FAM53A [Lingula anatina]XP_013383026.1 protein FAM53A [Lingula anatina]XP_013383027.1 protein FAM53A [Lingula anatina]XP_013383028.1 protein FAM53A [Lingula anatina]XP_013383029.1 protein FAM53A [Lingula anatina]XP_013383030.1 protein FAM53A [Lingula anatina]|eukprot:XP_013383024.1 protein FAM53A [Lingula anatina]